VIQEKSVSGDARARAQLKRNVLQEKAGVVAKIIKFYIPNSFRKKGEVDLFPTTREGNRVRLEKRKIGVS